MLEDTKKIAEIHGLASALLTVLGEPGAVINLPWTVVQCEAILDRCNTMLAERAEGPVTSLRGKTVESLVMDELDTPPGVPFEKKAVNPDNGHGAGDGFGGSDFE